ncbi:MULTISPECIES: helix-turn-helix domain-containing protein [Nocardiopsis]|uniref:Uncharacterized protein n=1 Tax=Nocardiopsis sinuspersici TaxID=501010 RepID=A0A1V3BVN6_9ACTN|nr:MULTISPECIES: hypothetical protein [Nocardiopsis]OOC52478.1 hypothetical protein NOSIN_00360 [Nocardiopsis sinuspersici]
MKLMWKKTTDPESPTEAVTRPTSTPTTRPLEKIPSGWTDPVRLISGVITVASAITTVWALWDLFTGDGADMAVHLVGLSAGLVVEGGWLLVLASNYQQAARDGYVARWRTVTGWVLAIGAALLLAIHGVVAENLAWSLLGLLPLISKTAWHVITHTRAQRTRAVLAVRKREEAAAAAAAHAKSERERELSADLTEEQQAELAALERETTYVTAKTEKELALEAARAHAEQQRVLADIRRRAEQQMTVDEASADIEVRRSELRNRIHLAAPLYTAQELPAGASPVPNDPSGFGVPPVGGAAAGFGAGLREARSEGGGRGGGIGRHPGGIAPDLRGRPSPTVGGGGNGHQGGDIGADQAERAPHHAARVAVGRDTRQRVLEEIGYAGVQVSNAELSRLLGIGRTTVRDHRNALRDAGHRVYPDSE